MKTGVELIAEERKRQIEKEGYSLTHDIAHFKGELAIAAACYAVSHINNVHVRQKDGTEYDIYPWKHDNRRKHDHLKCLVIAGALIAAEIDRLTTIEDKNEIIWLFRNQL